MEQNSTFWKSAMVYGLYLALILTLYSVIIYVTGFILNQNVGYIQMAITIAGIVICQLQYRNKELNGMISYGQAVGFGAAIMLFAGIITALYTLVLYTFIDPGLIDQTKAIQEEAMLAKGMSEDQIEAAMTIASKMLTPGWISIMVLVGSVFMGTIISLLSSIFIKKQPSEDAFDEAMEDVKTEE